MPFGASPQPMRKQTQHDFEALCASEIFDAHHPIAAKHCVEKAKLKVASAFALRLGSLPMMRSWILL
jgi:hypothetical protein